MGEAQSGPVWGLRAQLHIPCHLLHTLLKPLSPSQPHVLSQGFGCHPSCSLAGSSAGRESLGIFLRRVGTIWEHWGVWWTGEGAE